ncbi:MAG: hypothetical protein ACRDZ9_01220 [Acidimicrobiales bacterium]
MSTTESTCTCGCAAMTVVTKAEEPCGCGCECCGGEVTASQDEVVQLRNLRAGVERRLADLGER